MQINKDEEKELEKHLLRAEEDIKNGRTRDAKEVLREWEKIGRI